MGFVNIGSGGGSVTWKDPVATAGALPLANNTAGDARVAIDTGVVYSWNGASWTAPSGAGTVTSVGLSAPNIFTVSGTPVTGAGTLQLTLANQTANKVFAGVTVGGPAAPSFRSLVQADLPYPLQAPGGSAVAPAYGFQETGQDTGMYSTGDGEINWSNNATLGMTLDGSHNLTVVGTIAASNFPTSVNDNLVYAGPNGGGPAAPTFRSLAIADLPLGTGDKFVVYNNAGVQSSSPSFSVDNTTGGMIEALTLHPNGAGGGQVNSENIDFVPLQNSPAASYNLHSVNVQLDPTSTGFTMGTGGQALNIYNVGITHAGTGNTGSLVGTAYNYSLGNGTDPISVGGFGYSFAQGQVAAGVTINGPVQGYIFQPNFNAASSLPSYCNAFVDGANAPVSVDGWQSFSSGPQIGSITNNHNYVGYNLNANIGTLTGNAGCFSLALSPTIGTVNSGSVRGLNYNPTVTLNKGNLVGVDVSLTNVTNYAGVAASLVVQDITYTFNSVGANNNAYTIEYANTVLAGSETVVIAGNAITVNIESGVSTATQVKAACDANITFTGAITAVITGTASNAQVASAPANFTGGEDPGTSKAANFGGDVQITGALSFTGALSIGALTSFATKSITSGLGVTSVDMLITSPSVAANATITGTDLLGVNTAMLFNIGANASVTSNFLGYAALGLPAVVTMGAGSTIDKVGGATFAISLDGGAGGGTITEVALCKSLAIPNGITTVTKLKGYSFELPFGDPGTTTWGLYVTPTCHNFMAGDLKIGSGGDTAAATKALDVGGDATVSGDIACATLTPANGATGSFTTVDGKTVTVTNGIITSIV